MPPTEFKITSETGMAETAKIFSRYCMISIVTETDSDRIAAFAMIILFCGQFI